MLSVFDFFRIKNMFALVISAILIFCFSGCGNRNDIDFSAISANEKNTVSEFLEKEASPVLKADGERINAFTALCEYGESECPYSELFYLDEAFADKEKRDFNDHDHTYDFLNGEEKADPNKLIETVKKNNDEFLDIDMNKYRNKKLSDSKINEYCGIIADVMNWGLENTGVDKNDISCILGNLKILTDNSPDYGAFSQKNGRLIVSPDMIKSSKTGVSEKTTVCHEAMHMLQSRCIDSIENDGDIFYGISYKFGNLPVNSLNLNWIYEGSAEILMADFYGILPTTYTRDIAALELNDLSLLFNVDSGSGFAEYISFAKDENVLYDLLGFKDKRKAAGYLYAWEILLDKPDDFKKAYEEKHGQLSDYNEFVKTTYLPYVCGVSAKMFYKNLAVELTKRDMKENDVFYLISLYEMGLKKFINYNSADERERFSKFIEEYLNIRNAFFGIIDDDGDGLKNKYLSYSANYTDSDKVCANAEFDLSEDYIREHLLKRFGFLYDTGFKPIADQKND